MTLLAADAAGKQDRPVAPQELARRILQHVWRGLVTLRQKGSTWPDWRPILAGEPQRKGALNYDGGSREADIYVFGYTVPAKDAPGYTKVVRPGA
jgi:hypothetical protein